MDLKVLFVPQFHRVQLPSISRLISKKTKCNPLVCGLRVSCGPFRETFSMLCTIWKNIMAQCNDSEQSIHQYSVSMSDNVKLPELAFDQLQLATHWRGFGHFFARATWLCGEAHYESLPYIYAVTHLFISRHVDSLKGKYAEHFYALKKRCLLWDGNLLKCFCLVS
ncbi:hypothetical protein MKX01_017346, partial [Papaver californicum]